MTSHRRLHTVLAALSVPLLLLCSFSPGGGEFLHIAEAHAYGTEATVGASRAAHTPTLVERGCEIVEHQGTCSLDSVTAADLSHGDREVIAVYRVLDQDPEQRIERRFRVSYLDRSEAEQIELLRERSVLTCRWQTVIQGTCPAYPPEVELPGLDSARRRHAQHDDQADARERDAAGEGSHHRHHRRHRHHRDGVGARHHRHHGEDASAQQDGDESADGGARHHRRHQRHHRRDGEHHRRRHHSG